MRKIETSDAIDRHRRRFFGAAAVGIAAAAGAFRLLPATAHAAAEDDAIRPFRFNASDEALADLRRRIAATKWPSRELVTDASQGVQLATMREVARYWQTGYDWRKVEARLHALPQFTTNIDGLDIHFIHVRSKHPNALPILVDEHGGVFGAFLLGLQRHGEEGLFRCQGCHHPGGRERLS